VTEFLTALAKDDYPTANRIFPKVVEGSIKSLINKRKPEVVEQINMKASEHMKTSVLETEEESKKEE
jgi:hypothetical protein